MFLAKIAKDAKGREDALRFPMSAANEATRGLSAARAAPEGQRAAALFSRVSRNSLEGCHFGQLFEKASSRPMS